MNVSGTRYIEIGIPIPNAPLLAEGSAPNTVVFDMSEIIADFSYDPVKTFRVVTIGLESYSIRHRWGVGSFEEQFREPIVVVSPELQAHTKSRYVAMLPNDFGQGLSGAASVSLTGKLPSSLYFQVGLMDSDPRSSAVYNFNADRLGAWDSQFVREITVRFYLKVAFEPNRISVVGLPSANRRAGPISNATAPHHTHSAPNVGGGSLGRPGSGAPNLLQAAFGVDPEAVAEAVVLGQAVDQAVGQAVGEGDSEELAQPSSEGGASASAIASSRESTLAELEESLAAATNAVSSAAASVSFAIERRARAEAKVFVANEDEEQMDEEVNASLTGSDERKLLIHRRTALRKRSQRSVLGLNTVLAEISHAEASYETALETRAAYETLVKERASAQDSRLEF